MILRKPVQTGDLDTDQNLSQIETSTNQMIRKSQLFPQYEKDLEEIRNKYRVGESNQLQTLNTQANDLLNKQRQQILNTGPYQMLGKVESDLTGIFSDLGNIFTDQGRKDTNNKTTEHFDTPMVVGITSPTAPTTPPTAPKDPLAIIPPITSKSVKSYLSRFNNIISVFTKEGRLITSGIFIFVIALALYFIDITS